MRSFAFISLVAALVSVRAATGATLQEPEDHAGVGAGAPAPAAMEQDVCSQPAAVGPCRAAMPRWFYDSGSGECKTFTYGGCQGNTNNFQTKEECVETCDGSMTQKIVEEVEEVEIEVDVEIEEEQMVDVEAASGGDDGVVMGGENEEEEQEQEVEMIGDDVTEASDEEDNEVKDSSNKYGNKKHGNGKYGKNGNKHNGNKHGGKGKENGGRNRHSKGDNRHEAAGNRHGAGHKVNRKQHEACTQPKLIGRCKAIVHRWYYNQHSSQCEQFTYGGCGGNQNNFPNKAECEKKCEQHQHNGGNKGERPPPRRKPGPGDVTRQQQKKLVQKTMTSLATFLKYASHYVMALAKDI